MYTNRNYLIFPITEISKIDFSKVLETSTDTLRKSVNEEKSFIKWNGDQPEFISTILNPEGPYTHDEILTILSTPEWSAPMEI